MSSELLPRGASQDVVDFLQDLISRAEDRVVERHGGETPGGARYEAEVTHEMLQLSENHRGVIQVAQGYVVAYVARHELWHMHPDEYAQLGLREFLKSAGLSNTAVCNLTALGEMLVPYCDAREIKVDPLLTPDEWPKLREAIPALRAAVKKDEPAQVQSILGDVQKAATRDAVRVKYATPRTKYGAGTTLRLPDGRVVFVAVLDDDDAAATIVRRLQGGVTWQLLASTQTPDRRIVVTIDDARRSVA